MNAEVRAIKTPAEQALSAAFATARGTLPGKGAVAAMREGAFRQFDTRGLPHRRVEEWKYTDLRALMRDLYPLAPPPDAAARARAESAGKLLAGVKCRRLVFVDGAFVPDLSDLVPEPGLTIDSMANALGKSDPSVAAHVGQTFATDDVAVALNTALMGDGAVIRVSGGAVLKRPINLVFATGSDKPTSAFVRSLVVVEKGAKATIIESHESGDAQVNAALELVVGDEAQVDYIKITQSARFACREPARHDRRARLFQQFRLHGRFRRRAQSEIYSLRRGRHQGQYSWRHAAAGQGARRHHAIDRARRRPLRKSRAIQGGARRRESRGVPGQDRRQAARAEDRRKDDDTCAAALRRS